MPDRPSVGATAIVLDTETTGVDSYRDRVVEVAAQRMSDGQVLINTLVRPDISISAEATATHGITNEAVRTAPLFSAIAQDLANIIGSAEALIGYNPFFDRGILANEFARASVSVRWPILVCAKRLWNKHDPQNRKLASAYRRFVGGEFKAHRALSDADATRRVVAAQFEEFGLHGTPWAELDPEQRQWVGPTSHLIVDHSSGAIVINFGKHKGEPVVRVPRRYWQWIDKSADFPVHILQLAWQMTRTRKTETEILAWIKEHLR